ncbi:MAG: DUF4382 domain-containing protein [Mucinivorans sp.]
MAYKKYILALLVFISLVGCSAKNYQGEPMFVLYVEDSPANYDAVDIVVDSVELLSGQKWIKLKSMATNIPLLTLTGGEHLRLAQGEIPAGSYQKMRLYFAQQGATLATNKKTYPLTLLPEWRVVELPFAFEVTINEQVVTMCDIDVAASIGGNEIVGYNFNPRCTIVNLASCGALSGVIADKDSKNIAERMWLRAIAKDGTIKSSYTNNKTGKIFMRLAGGDYKFIITPSGTSKYAPDTIMVTVLSDEATAIGARKLKLLPKP